jgi:hypothetical protein
MLGSALASDERVRAAFTKISRAGTAGVEDDVGSEDDICRVQVYPAQTVIHSPTLTEPNRFRPSPRILGTSCTGIIRKLPFSLLFQLILASTLWNIMQDGTTDAVTLQILLLRLGQILKLKECTRITRI